MKKIVFAINILFIVNFLNAQAPSFLFASQLGGSGGEYGNSIKVDPSGNIYIAGYFSNTADFDPGAGIFNMTSVGAEDVFVAKFDALNNLIWAKQWGGSLKDVAASVAVDVSGNVYITGTFNSTVDFDPGAGTYPLTSIGLKDAFVSKLDPSGNFVWAKQFGSSANEDGISVATDASGNVYSTGTFSGTVDFDPSASIVNLTPFGWTDTYISKLDASGNFVWAKQFAGSAHEIVSSIAIDPSGNVLTTGYFSSACDFDPGAASFILPMVGAKQVFVSKLNASGNFVWAKSMGGVDEDNATSIAVDASGNVYTTGFFENTADFDPGAGTFNLNGSGGLYSFVSKLDASGNFVWAKQLGGVSTYALTSPIIVDSFGNVYTAGYFGGTCDFDPGAGVFNLTSIESSDTFISKLDALGNFVWAAQLTATGIIYPTSLTIDSGDNLFTTGSFGGTCDFDLGAGVFNLVSAGVGDVFFQKMNACTAPLIPVNTTPGINLNICAGESSTLTASSSGTVSWYSTPSGTMSIGSGATFMTPTLSAGTYTYYAEAVTCGPSAARTAITVTVSACVGIKDLGSIQNAEINVYPNPTNSIINIDFVNFSKEASTFKIYNSLGEIVLSDKVTSQSSSINIQHFAKGIYILKAESSGHIKTVKIIKE